MFGHDFATTFAPVGDWFNHSYDFNAMADFNDEGFFWTTTKDIPKGEQIFISYGDKPNSLMLLNYGFTLTNPNR